jgi:hypothetical protein
MSRTQIKNYKFTAAAHGYCYITNLPSLSYKDRACCPFLRQLTCHVNLFFSAFRVAGDKPATSTQFLLNPDSSARGRAIYFRSRRDMGEKHDH